jgi:hypothetical protein
MERLSWPSACAQGRREHPLIGAGCEVGRLAQGKQEGAALTERAATAGDAGRLQAALEDLSVVAVAESAGTIHRRGDAGQLVFVCWQPLDAN